MSEDILQSQIFRWYHNTYCTKLNSPRHLIFSVPNGAYTSKAQAMKLKATGLIAGVSDLIIIRPNKITFCELKIGTGKQSDKQIDFQNTVTALGFDYVICRSLEEFKKIFNEN